MLRARVKGPKSKTRVTVRADCSHPIISRSGDWELLRWVSGRWHCGGQQLYRLSNAPGWQVTWLES